jgi:hypothetical protein
MKVFDLKNDQGRLFAFEVSNTVIGRGGACFIVQSIPGATIVRGPTAWWWKDSDEFCEFDLGERRFVIAEPFNDNSRYWIGPQPPNAGSSQELGLADPVRLRPIAEARPVPAAAETLAPASVAADHISTKRK